MKHGRMKLYTSGLAIFLTAGLIGCGQPDSHDKEFTDLNNKMNKISDSLHKLPPEASGDKESIQDLKSKIEMFGAKLERQPNMSKDASVDELLKRMADLEDFFAARQTPFHKACVNSLNVADADDLVKRNVVNAIAFINSSKVARATPISQNDYDSVNSLSTGVPSGYVFVGTRSEHRKANNSYTYYAFSRLPSPSNYESLSYLDFELANDRISGFGSSNIDKFGVSDKNHVHRTLSRFEILGAQDALEAIDANVIESYTRDDCDKIATYMSNVGSKALTSHVDDTLFHNDSQGSADKSGHLNFRLQNDGKWVSDVLSRLNERYENYVSTEYRATQPKRDSHRVMVLQDALLRRDENGRIDYSFLDLVQAPHLRFLAAFDSEIGGAKLEAGSDFDNDYQGKNASLIGFVKRHRTQPELKRSDKAFRDLEAVFINVVPEVVVEPTPEEKAQPENLFHT